MKQSVVQRRPLSRPLYQDALDAASAIAKHEVGLRGLRRFIEAQETSLDRLQRCRRAEVAVLWREWSRTAARAEHLRTRLERNREAADQENFALGEQLEVMHLRYTQAERGRRYYIKETREARAAVRALRPRVARWQRVAGGMGAVVLVKGLVLLHLVGVF